MNFQEEYLKWYLINRSRHFVKWQELKDWCLGLRTIRRLVGKEIVSAPKYEFVTSHIMRRSFASNYYGKIETPLLMNITGHSKESTFLTYIGTHQNKDALADLFMQQAGVIW